MSNRLIKLLRICGILLLTVALSACGRLAYYAHSINGHLTIMSQRQDIDKLRKDPKTDAKLKQKLHKVQQIRRFASKELLLPDNKSFKKYADLKRPYVVWNVVAAPEFSVKPKTWCFLFAGCISYRGYFSKDKAQQFADKLKAQGLDVTIGGVTAYSTLGWFADPVLNTFIHYPTSRLAGLIFHELAHQKIYVKSDSAFSESLATTVELEGTRRWIQRYDSNVNFQSYLERKNRQRRFVVLIQKYRTKLERHYEKTQSIKEKREGKKRIFRQMQAEYQILKKGWGNYSGYDAWFSRDLNNAHLASVGTYHNYVPALQKLLRRTRGNLQAFYREAEKLAALPEQQRKQRLQQINSHPD